MSIPNSQDFVPETDWPAISVMLDGFGEQTLSATTALSDSTILMPGDEHDTVYTFLDGETVAWSSTGNPGSTQGTAPYKAIEARAGLFIINFLRGTGLDTENVTIVLDRTSGIITSGISRLVTIDGNVRSVTDFSHTSIDGQPIQRERSSGLVGKRVFYRYSDSETYEHIYLNSGTFTWHCLRGGEAGLADTDRCMAWEVAEDVFIFFWTEKVMAVEAVLLVDLREQRSIGRMFGWDHSAAGVVSLPFNSRLSVLNTTEYPQDLAKL
ncbi:MoaF C-terminal domain-containing protein [Glutamicibacter sp. X7]